METFIAIFTQLGVGPSLLPQFFIILIVFIVANFVFLGKLQEVLETREEKTVKLENSADDILEKVSHMQTEYKLKIDEANRSSIKTASEKKQNISQKYTEQFKQTEKEVNQFVDQSRVDFSKEIENNREKYLAETETLAQSLVQKILQ